jgi:HipA-like kinase
MEPVMAMSVACAGHSGFLGNELLVRFPSSGDRKGEQEMTLSITRSFRKLRGQSQAHLMQASDGGLYVVKLQGNPQGTKVLANELLASRIAERIGLPMAHAEVVHLPDKVATTLAFETAGGKVPIRPGLHCGLRVICPFQGRMYEILPRSEERNVQNLNDVVGAQLFDFWTRKRERRQCIFWRSADEKRFRISFIDSGHCFGGPGWQIGKSTEPLRTKLSYSPIFLKWINLIADVTKKEIASMACEIPPEWYGYDRHALNTLIAMLFS